MFVIGPPPAHTQSLSEDSSDVNAHAESSVTKNRSAILLDRRTLGNPIQLAFSLMSYRMIYSDIYFLQEDYAGLVEDCREMTERGWYYEWAERASGRKYTLEERRDHEVEDRKALGRLDREWAEVKFSIFTFMHGSETEYSSALKASQIELEHAERLKWLKKVRRGTVNSDIHLATPGSQNIIASWALVEEAKKADIIKEVSFPDSLKFYRKGRPRLHRYNNITRPLVRDSIGTRRLVGKLGEPLEIVLSKTAFWRLKGTERRTKWDSALIDFSKRSTYVGATLEKGWTLQTLDGALQKWLLLNMPVELVPPEKPLGRIRHAIDFDPGSFTVVDVMNAIKNDSFLEKISVVLDEVERAENRKRMEKEILIMGLGAVVGQAAGSTVKLAESNTAVRGAIDTASEALIRFTSYLFKRKRND